jgi:hypothetical protein
MDGFIDLLTDFARVNGLADARVCADRAQLTLPGCYRATKSWDILILNGPHLLAAIELKSQVGPPSGNNFNICVVHLVGDVFG